MTTSTPPPSPERSAEVWREQLGQRRATSSAPTIVACPGHIAGDLSRRHFILRSFWTGLDVTVAAGLGLDVNIDGSL
jgi:hypothetical protein